MTGKRTIRKYYRITGMSCRNCERKIEERINRLPGVIRCKADYVKGMLHIDFESEKTPEEPILTEISDGGYGGSEINSPGKISRESLPVVLAGIIIIVFYLTAGRTGLLNRIPEISVGMGYPFLFVIGILTSLHCIGMCGGINLSQSSMKSHGTDRYAPVKNNMKYNAGRIISYTLLGGIVGGIGSVLYLSLTMQVVISMGAGVIMIIMGLNMLGLLSKLRVLIPVMPESLSCRLRWLRGKGNPFLVGILNGFMPCGPLQSMQIYALSTGSITKGALSMFLFSAGTVPLMFAFGTFSFLFNSRGQKSLMKVSALLILILGGGMISRGLSLNGMPIPQSTGESAIGAAVSRIEGDVQIVSSRVSPSAYEPIVVQAGIPVRWTLEAGPGDITGCNNAIVSREFGIRQNLSEGSTLVEFTPKGPGNFGFTCWMGMINSHILVVEDLAAFDPELLNTPPESSGDRVEIIIPEFGLEDIGYSEISMNDQSSTTIVDEDGFRPSIMVMERSKKTTWNFRSGKVGDKTGSLLFPTFNARLDLTADSDRSVELVPEGDFYFYSWKGDFLGFVITVDDMGSLSGEDILKRVNSYLSQ